MHQAPSVTYPVERSAFAGRLHGLLAGAGVAASIAWMIQAQAAGWRQGVALAAALACGAFAFIAWRRSPRGRLQWDGAAWHWIDEEGQAAGAVDLSLDLQSRMLLCFRGDESARRWLWVERASDVSHWDALRRAVYSRANTPVAPAGPPPAAEQ